MSERTLPYDIDAERATLGSVLMNREAIVPIAPWLVSPAFYLDTHGWIYDAMLACYRDHIPPDVRMVADRLRTANRLDAIGGYVYLAELLDAVPTSHHVEHYARIVERCAVQRKGILAAGKIAQIMYEASDIEQAIAQAQTELTTATMRGSAAGGLEPIGTVLSRRFDAITGGRVPGLATGLADYDRITGGLMPGRLIILAGRPGQGKTALATQAAVYAAEQGKTVAFFSLEMPREEVADRIAAARGEINTQALTQHRLNDDQTGSLVDVCGWAQALPLYIDDTPGVTVDFIRAIAMRLRLERDALDLVIVDYLQLMSAPRRDGNRVQEVSEISRGLKALAKELRCPVVALAQLSRAVDARSDPTPVLSDLRESGQIEADADQVVFIVRPELYGKTERRGMADLTIAKHRGGALGKVELKFDAQYTRFFNVEKYRAPEGY